MRLIYPGPPRSLRILVGQVIGYGVMSCFGLWQLWRGLSVGRLPLKRMVVDGDSPFFSSAGLVWALFLLVVFMLWGEAIATLTSRSWRRRRPKEQAGDDLG